MIDKSFYDKLKFLLFCFYLCHKYDNDFPKIISNTTITFYSSSCESLSISSSARLATLQEQYKNNNNNNIKLIINIIKNVFIKSFLYGTKMCLKFSHS